MSELAITKFVPFSVDGDKVASIPFDAIPAALGELERLKAMLWIRFLCCDRQSKQQRPDRLLTAKETAEKMSVSTDYIYDHAKNLPFTVREWRKVLFSERGLERYLHEKQKPS